MSKEGMVPKVRFYNFNDEWFIKSLEEISEIIMGQSPKSEYYTDNPSDYILVQGNADIKNGSVAPRAYTSKPTKLAEKGNIILTVRAPVGEVAKTDYEVVLGRGVSSLKGNEFLYQKLLMMNKVNYWEKFSTGSTFQSINSNDIRNAKLLVPIAEEQQKIGDLFEKLDQAISLQQQVLETTKEYKQSMLQKMFPKKGEKVPEIRFKEFNDSWKDEEIKEISKNIGGTPLEKHIDSQEHYKFISIGNYSKDGKYIDNGQRISLNEKTREKLLQKNDIAMVLNDKTKTGDIIGSSILIDEDNKYIYNQRTQRVIFDNNLVNNIFIWTLLNNSIFRSEVFRRSQGGTQIYINFSEVEKITVKIPSLEEQQKIGSFFKTLDEKIEQEEKKLEAYESMKKALMQRMFL